MSTPSSSNRAVERPNTAEKLNAAADYLGELPDWCPRCLGYASGHDCPDCSAIWAARKVLQQWARHE